MPAPTTFDTLDYARKLEKAGVPAPQAEMQAQALAQVFAESVASRSDLFGVEQRLDTTIDTVESRLTAKIDTVESRLDAKINAVKTELTLDLGGRIDTLKWMVTFFGAVNVGILVKLLVS